MKKLLTKASELEVSEKVAKFFFKEQNIEGDEQEMAQWWLDYSPYVVKMMNQKQSTVSAGVKKGLMGKNTWSEWYETSFVHLVRLTFQLIIMQK